MRFNLANREYIKSNLSGEAKEYVDAEIAAVGSVNFDIGYFDSYVTMDDHGYEVFRDDDNEFSDLGEYHDYCNKSENLLNNIKDHKYDMDQLKDISEYSGSFIDDGSNVEYRNDIVVGLSDDVKEYIDAKINVVGKINYRLGRNYFADRHEDHVINDKMNFLLGFVKNDGYDADQLKEIGKNVSSFIDEDPDFNYYFENKEFDKSETSKEDRIIKVPDVENNNIESEDEFE